METATDIAFLEEVKRYNELELRVLVDHIYTSLSKKCNHRVSFGRSGSIELVAGLILSNFDDSTRFDINYGIEQVFLSTWNPNEFSNFMDKIILETGIISYPTWSKAYRFIEKNHAWLTEHPCSGANTNSSFSKGEFINS